MGNPNSGKTSLFNALTGAAQKVGNYPGVTVEKTSALSRIGTLSVEFVDVPGLYNLDPISEDERIAVQVLDQSPDLIVCVVDAYNLERNLYLVSELAQRGLPMVIALTMVDMIGKRGGTVDSSRLANLLGVDVIEVVAHRGRGLSELRACIERNLESPRHAKVPELSPTPISVKAAALRERLLRAGFDIRQDEIREALIGKGDELMERVHGLPEVHAEFEAARKELEGELDREKHHEAEQRYAWSEMVHAAVFHQAVGNDKLSATDRIDQVLTNRVFGFAIFILVMYGVFQAIYTLAGPLMSLIEFSFGWMGDTVGPYLEPWPVVQSATVDGLIAGIGAVVIFLPQILILFFLIAILEGTGYLARAAFLMDRLLGWCGLNGRAFIPLLSSFACAIPGIMAARVMPDSRGRLATILVSPLMSCSARLPVYVLLIGAFIEPQFGAFWAGFTLFAMHFLGLAVAIPIVFILNRGVLKGGRLPFLLELPPYQMPKWRDVFLAMYLRGRVFLIVAGTTIVTMSIVIWALLYFPRSDEATQRYIAEHAELPAMERELISAEAFVLARQTENSYLGRIGKFIEPAFVPAGFDWRISTAILAAFPARELVVPSLGIIFSLGSEQDEESVDLRKAMQKATTSSGSALFTPYTAIGMMVFFALCAQCLSTLAVVKRETNSWKWPIFMFIYMSGLAYLGALAVHRIGLALS